MQFFYCNYVVPLSGRLVKSSLKRISDLNRQSFYKNTIFKSHRSKLFNINSTFFMRVNILKS